MAQPPLADPTRCGCRTGVIFVRPCQGTPVTACSQCRISLCVAHRRPYGNLVLCPDCYARLEPDSDTRFDSDRSRYTPSTDYGGGAVPADAFAGQGGEFGGGGASGGWSEEPEAAADALAESPFTAEDYAAFDAVSDYDRSDEKGGGYDS